VPATPYAVPATPHAVPTTPPTWYMLARVGRRIGSGQSSVIIRICSCLKPNCRGRGQGGKHTGVCCECAGCSGSSWGGPQWKPAPLLTLARAGLTSRAPWAGTASRDDEDAHECWKTLAPHPQVLLQASAAATTPNRNMCSLSS
jgi:hypothetical protein